MPRNFLVRKLFGSGKRGDNMIYFFIAVNFTRRILINGIRSSARARTVYAIQSSHCFDSMFPLFSLLVHCLHSLADLRGKSYFHRTQNHFRINSIAMKKKRNCYNLISKYPLNAAGNLIPILTKQKRINRTTHTHTRYIELNTRKKYIVQLFVCRKKKWQLFGVFFLFSSFHTWNRIAGSQTGATKTRIELISCVAKHRRRRLYIFMLEPIDFVKLSYFFFFKSCLCLSVKYSIHFLVDFLSCLKPTEESDTKTKTTFYIHKRNDNSTISLNFFKRFLRWIIKLHSLSLAQSAPRRRISIAILFIIKSNFVPLGMKHFFHLRLGNGFVLRQWNTQAQLRISNKSLYTCF